MEEASDRLAPLKPAQVGGFPQRVLCEQHRDPVGIVLGVTQGGIACLQVADCRRVLQRLQAPLQPFEPCQVKSIVLRHLPALAV